MFEPHYQTHSLIPGIGLASTGSMSADTTLWAPKGWTGPKQVDGRPVEGTFRSHQVPLAAPRENAEHPRLLEERLRSYDQAS